MKLVNKKNTYLLFLLIISLLGLVIIPTYAKFPSNYITENDIVGLSLDFNIEITNIEEYEEITISPGSREQFNIELTNADANSIYYGVWYRMINPENIISDIAIGKLEGTDTNTSGTINGSSSTTVTIGIINNSTTEIKLHIGVASSITGTSDIEYLGGKYLITGEVTINFLNEMAVGSYIAYTGNNGCEGASCNGQNANYVSDTNMGYCDNSNLKFTVNGWRIAYIEEDTAYLVSAGAVECMCTNSDGTTSSSSCSNYANTSTTLAMHLDNLDTIALKYCNTSYAYGEVCNSSSDWSMDSTDLKKISGVAISHPYEIEQSSSSWTNNTLVNNEGYYWLATLYNGSNEYVSSVFYYWNPSSSPVMAAYYSERLYGVRPVIRLDSSVYVTGGSGTYVDPYTISN